MYEFPYVLTINAGSSSLKAEFFALPTRAVLHECVIEDIGLPSTRSTVTSSGTTTTETLTNIGHREALDVLVLFIKNHYIQQPTLVAHRIVHGGKHFTEPTRLNAESITLLRTLEALAPNHLPTQISYIEYLMNTYPAATHVGCFDTAFHAQMPHVAQLMTLPRQYSDAGVRRYGFHGLSYEYIVQTLKKSSSLPSKLICAHLGNGASICAIHNGVSIETSMGMTPSSGTMMSTRSGDIDPGVVRYMESVHALTPLEFDTLTNKESGLKGVSGTTGDMRELLALRTQNSHAQEAIDLFCYSIKKYIGAYAALLNGVDMIVFTGGIGERSAYIRNEICKNLEYLGVELLNDTTDSSRILNHPSSRVRVEVIHTDESAMMYEHALNFLAL